MAVSLQAQRDFDQAHRRAFWEEVTAFLTGKSADLLSFEEVHDRLKAYPASGIPELKEIPLNKIVGSVGRYHDFTRSFLPRNERVVKRWARVDELMQGLEGLPPIEVYQIGDVYFVQDGNHRVSVARQQELETIQAYVKKYHTSVPLTPDTTPDDLIIKGEYADFLNKTKLNELRPEARIELTAPGKYEKILRWIATNQHYMDEHDPDRQATWEDAVVDWYDNRYLPMVEIIREKNMLANFPERTEADLYVWIRDHQKRLQECLGQPVPDSQAADDLTDMSSPKTDKVLNRVVRKTVDALTPDRLEEGPPPGTWRMERVIPRDGGNLFTDVLIPVDGSKRGWYALEQAFEIARLEGECYIHGLHVLKSRQEEARERGQEILSEFCCRCKDAGFRATTRIESGGISRLIVARAKWADLVVMHEQGEHSQWPKRVLGSTFHTVVRRVARPVWVLPDKPVKPTKALLAYDGSPKAREALYVSSYIKCRWGLSLLIMTSQDLISETQQVIDCGSVNVAWLSESEPIDEAIVNAAEQYECDLLIMGGYGLTPALEVFLSSTVDRVLRKTAKPILICR